MKVTCFTFCLALVGCTGMRQSIEVELKTMAFESKVRYSCYYEPFSTGNDTKKNIQLLGPKSADKNLTNLLIGD